MYVDPSLKSYPMISLRLQVSYKLQVLLRTERATALITQKIEKDKENTER